MELITVKTFDNAMEAHILKSKLESEHIDSFIFDEHIVGINMLYAQSVGGVKLKIRKEDEDAVKVLLAEIENYKYTDLEDKPIHCPNCDGTDFYSYFKSNRSFKGILSTIMSFIFFIYPFYHKNVLKCKHCNHEIEL